MSFFSKNSGRRWFLLLCIFLLVAAVLQSVLYLTCYDSEIGLYKQGFPTGVLKAGYFVVALLLVSGCVCLPLLIIKKTKPDCFPSLQTKKSSLTADFFALLSAASIAATLITQLIRVYAEDPLSILLLNPSDANATARTMLLVSLGLALPATLYFIGLYARKNWTYPLVFTILWVCTYMLRVYFDVSSLLMSPTRLLTIAAMAVTVLFLLAELRHARSIFSPMMYAVTATLTALFAGVSGFSGLLLTAVGPLEPSTETPYFAFQLTIALFALFRLKAMMIPALSAFEQAEQRNKETV